MPAPFHPGRFRFALVTGLVLGGTLACAAAPARAEDLMQILALAQQYDPQVAEARERYEAEHTLLAQGLSRLLPSVTLSGRTSRNAQATEDLFSYAQGFNAHSYGISLEQAVINMQAWYGWEAAKASDRGSLASLVQAEQELIMRVARAYFDVLRSEEALAAFQAEEEAAAAILNQTTQRAEVGLAAITDVNEAQANHDLARVNRLREERNLNQRRLSLEVITGRSHGELDGLSADFPIESPQPSRAEEWVAMALENNPALQVASHTFDARKEEVRAARAARLPTVSLSASYNDNAESQNPFSFFPGVASNSASIQLSVSVPLYTGGMTSARLRQAYHQQNASEFALERVRRESERNTRDSFIGVEMDVQAVAARRQAVVSAQSALDAVEAGAEVGTRNTVDVVLAQRTLFQAMRDLATARYDYVIDTLSLKQAAGVLTPEDVRALNEWLE